MELKNQEDIAYLRDMLYIKASLIPSNPSQEGIDDLNKTLKTYEAAYFNRISEVTKDLKDVEKLEQFQKIKENWKEQLEKLNVVTDKNNSIMKSLAENKTIDLATAIKENL